MLIDLTGLLDSYGYWGVLLFTAVEGTGIPFPPAKLFTAAAIYAGTTHRLSLPLIVGAAILGALVGSTASFWVGRTGGSRLLRRFGRSLGLHQGRLKLAQDVFLKHGGKIVVIGRFVPVLGDRVAFLAGTSSMRWPSFLLFNTLGTIGWAMLYGVGGYLLGNEINRVGVLGGIALLVLMMVGLLVGRALLRRHEKRLIADGRPSGVCTDPPRHERQGGGP